ncbi:vesicle-associated membrane protein 5 [Python bivittatus]|uniref:Vesicle-associated membrane protein 5 n=1 Tax=Python bivittatus TaxID=176946 RepID=A0A9F2R2W6_PYTBI|nr:vesicle-associated membrane protein 5 [Python bivittatus]
MDFIIELPESRGKTAIWVVTDLFSKQAHFVACRQIPTVEKLAQLFIQQGENHLKRCQQEAEEVTEIMLDNFTKVLDREGKLSDLDERADELRKQSSAFTKTAKTLAQKKRWDNMKFKIILLAVAVVAILLIILAIVLSFTLSGSGSQVAPAKTSAGGD